MSAVLRPRPLALARPVLLVAGSAEARALACQLPRKSAVVHLSPDRTGRDWPLPQVRGDPADLARDLRALGVAAILDASHPCDARASQGAVVLAQSLGLPICRVMRPPWRAGRGDDWTRLRRARDAARVIPRGARIFCTVGRDGLPELRNLSRNPVLVRQMARHGAPFPLARGRWIWGAGPFSIAEEVALLQRLRADWLILRNAGGAGGWPKLAAARHLGLPVAMIARPPLAQCNGLVEVQEPRAALDWLAEQEAKA